MRVKHYFMSKQRISTIIVSTIALLCFVVQGLPLTTRAFEATSTSFELHAGDLESAVGTSTSATFKLQNAGGQNATASSSATTKSVSAGILYWFLGFFNARYEQTHYRWRNDDGTETTATFPINEDTQYNQFAKNTVKRIRIEVSNEGWTRGVAPQLRLEVASTTTCSSGTYSAVPTDYSTAWHLATSTIVADATATTDFAGSLTNSNANFVAGQVKTTGNTTSAITLTSADFTEVEYGVLATGNAPDGATYCFRVTDNGGTSNMAYTELEYAKAVIASGLSPTGTLDSAVFDTFTTASSSQGPAYNSIMWNGTEGTGKVRFQFAASDCANGQTDYPACGAGTWSFIGSSNGGATCNGSLYYDTLTSGTGGGPGKPVEISCAGSQSQNNKRYYKYRIQICSSDCSGSGVTSPVVSGVVVNYAP